MSVRRCSATVIARLVGMLMIVAGASAAQDPAVARDTGVTPSNTRSRGYDADGQGSMVGLRTRLKVVDSSGTQLRLDGMIVDGDSTRLQLRCRSASARVGPGQVSSATIIAAPRCDGRVQSVPWEQIRQMEVRRMRAAGPTKTLANTVHGTAGGDVFGGFVGAVGAMALDLAFTIAASQDEDVPRPRIWWSHVRYGAIGGGALGGLAGGVMSVAWSRGVWVRVPLNWK